ncbi:MAG: 4Fe-4S binding protein [Candidatus Thorarchaeota archaeon]
MTDKKKEEEPQKKPRIGVFVCHCGENIAGVVDVKAVAEYAATLPNVEYSTDYLFMCSKQGIELIQKAVKEHNLDRTVVASCSHEQHWPTFAKAISDLGFNPHMHTQVNIREWCSWVTDDKKAATEKAKRMVAAGVARAALKEPVGTQKLPVTKRSMVVGGGVAGLRAAMDLAELGIPVVLVEKETSIGGHMTMLNKTFPTDECPMCTVSPLLNGVMAHPNIEVLTLSEVTNVEGTMGNFTVEVTTKPRYVHDNCTSCGRCAEVCPVEVKNEWDHGFGMRKAVYKPFPQALPSVFTVDMKHCIDCGSCVIACPVNAIDFSMKKEKRTFEVGTIVVATGYEEYDPTEITAYHYEHPNIITQLQMERMLAPTTLTKGKIVRPSDGKVPRTVVVVQCVGSRNDQVGNEYCTGVCCMYGIKNSGIIKEHLPDTEVFFCYIDIRTPGLHYEEYYKRAQKKGIRFIRGRPATLTPDPKTGNIYVEVEDTLTRTPLCIEADLVVLSAGMIAPRGFGKLGAKLGLLRAKEGFAKEYHIKMGPVRSSRDGVFLAGAIQGPMDITQTVAHAGGAASAAAQPLVRGYLEKRMDTAVIDEKLCTSCMACLATCPIGAITVGEKGMPVVNDAACKSCGACVPACPVVAIQIRNFRDSQISAEVSALLAAATAGGSEE